MKRIFKTRWSLMRWIRFVVGMLAITNFFYATSLSIQTMDTLLLGFGLYFITAALFTWDCELSTCSASSFEKLTS